MIDAKKLREVAEQAQLAPCDHGCYDGDGNRNCYERRQAFQQMIRMLAHPDSVLGLLNKIDELTNLDSRDAEVITARSELRRMRDDLDGARAELRREQDARAQLRVELDQVKGRSDLVYVVQTHAQYEGSTLEWVGASFEAARAHADGIDTNLDVSIDQWRDDSCQKVWERLRAGSYRSREFVVVRRLVLPAPKQPCCPQSTLPGSPHDVGCRGGGKVH